MHVELITPALTQAPERTEPLRVKDIAAALRVDKSTVYAEIKAGRLESYRIGQGRGTIRVSRAVFTQYLAERGIPAAELGVELCNTAAPINLPDDEPVPFALTAAGEQLLGGIPEQPAPPMHPTACPAWCKDRTHRIAHHFGPTATAHMSPQLQLANPAPLAGDPPVMLRAELFQLDERADTGEPVLYLQGETDVELDAARTDMFITDMQAFVDKLRVLRSQMDTGRQA